MQQFGLAPQALELEVTESLVMDNPEHAVTLLNRLKDRGIHLAMDDFGTGYSSLAYLKHFPIDVLKIDQSFVRDIGTDADDMAISRAIIAMAKNLSLTVIAEGVETVEQLDFLRQNGCDAYQGFHFNRPVPAEAMTALLQARTSKA